MKNNLKIALQLSIFCLVLFMTSCEKDLYEDKIQDNSYKVKMLNFKEFKEKTGMHRFDNNIRVQHTIVQSDGRTIELRDFVVDTSLVKEMIAANKTNFSLKIIPLEEAANSKELYNLVYEYNNGGWKETVYLLKEMLQPTDEKKYETLEVVFDSEDTLNVAGGRFYTCFGETYTFHCTGTGPCATGVCDWCSLCVTRSIATGLCYQDEGLTSQPLFLANDGMGNGGGAASETESNATDDNCDGSIECSSYNLYLQFKLSLNVEQRAYINNNSLESNAILYFLSENFFSAQSKIHAKQMITSMMNNDGYSGDGYLGDGDDTNEDYNGPKEHIPHQIVLNDGSTVQVIFGTTSTDNESADQEVATRLVDAIVFALNEANTNLPASEKITSIYVKATTNGIHSEYSNHGKGTAVDISRINGNKIINLGNNSQVAALQNAFDAFEGIRENFGPHFRHKTFPNGSVNLNWPVGGHRDHIHVSVQSN
ncbi:hypothetical protein [Flavobacterium sedimenticola]|uniref:Peptidase M15A C-terminal domain-containing protein n=1 Tax=Flavobacterium sedimenticola TaxID=3043286 RepID=A0ABT6XPU2_9FLAO|nr:hypothetical protein [Flavobacterium sedimenticola]MDI9257110.1 hypothetical protein [Flavobacterium sedimenticola]